MQSTPPEGCSAAPLNDSNLFLWNASIIGPDDSPWEGGIYSIRLQFPEAYPSKPPKVSTLKLCTHISFKKNMARKLTRAGFMCEMWHPNVYTDGTLCLDIVQDNWSPIYTVASILTSIQSLLTDPNPASPANPEAAKMFTENPKEYRKRVRRVAVRSLES